MARTHTHTHAYAYRGNRSEGDREPEPIQECALVGKEHLGLHAHTVHLIRPRIDEPCE
jgi:hypothetical protein